MANPSSKSKVSNPKNRNSRRSSIVPAKDATRRKIERMEAEREERRRAMQERQRARQDEHERNVQAGNPGDVDFIGLVRRWRESHAHERCPHESLRARICVAVRKRPLRSDEKLRLDHDTVTCYHPNVWIHGCKTRVDGISKYLDHTTFKFDQAFAEDSSTEDVYRYTTRPLLEFSLKGQGGRSTVFAYGQTGSGKTHTMNGIQECLCRDLYDMLDSNTAGCSRENATVSVGFFEMYGGMVQDLLNNRNRLKVLEDGNGEIVVNGLSFQKADSPEEFMEVVRTGQELRTTHATEANDSSSRSHAICQILLQETKRSTRRSQPRLLGKISLVDLAGSERGSDTKSHNSQRRAESADINTSLLALKECVRALDSKASHVPYRSSKLTLLLKDCFTSAHSQTTMIATVSPGASATDHTLNTLRYADRIKSQRATKPTRATSLSPNRGMKPTRSTSLSPTRPPHSGTSAPPRKKASTNATTISPTRRNTRPKPPISVEETPTAESMSDAESCLSDLLKTESSEDEKTPTVRKQKEELRRTVKSLFEQEEGILSMHMRNIQENAELLTEEGKLLEEVQRKDVTEDEFEEYVKALESVLDRKETMIMDLQEKLLVFADCLEKEQELSKKVDRDFALGN